MHRTGVGMTSPSPNLALQQQYFNTAYELLDRGLSLDEAERYEDALSFYRQAVRQLQLGISINFTKEEEYVVYIIGTSERVSFSD